MRQNLEKRLTALLEESQENRRKYLEKKYAVRYHKVRFFERIKVERTIKKLKKELKKSSDDSLKEKLAMAEEDLEYILHFPKGEKYVSILKDAEDAEAQKHLENERKRLRLIVKQQLKDEAIVNELNEGMPSGGDDDGHIDGNTTKVRMEQAETSESDDGSIEDDDFFAQSSGESDSPVSDDGQQSQGDGTPEGMSLQSDSKEESISLHETDEDDHTLPRVRSVENQNQKPSGIPRTPGVDGKSKEMMPKPTKRPNTLRQTQKNAKKSHIGIGKGRMQKKTSSMVSKEKKKEAKQPVRTRAEGGRKRRKKRS